MAPKADRSEAGIALVVVLWMGLLVAAIAGAFVLDTRTSARLARNFVDSAEVRAVADGGVHLAAFALSDPDPGRRWSRDGRAYRPPVDGGEVEIAIVNESGRIDLNRASPELIEGLFRAIGIDAAGARRLARAVVAGRGDGAAETVPGSEPGSGGAPFAAVDGLAGIDGMTPEIFERVRDAVTVHGGERLHLPSARPLALLAIPGMTAETVERFLEDRRAGDANAAADALLGTGRVRDFAADPADQGAFVTVTVVARSPAGARFVRRAVVELLGTASSPFAIRQWREGTTTESLPDDRPSAQPGTGT